MTTFKPWTAPPRLVVGEMVRDLDDGKFYRVISVTPGAARLYQVYAKSKTVSFTSVEGTVAFTARTAREPIYVSPHAFMEHLPYGTVEIADSDRTDDAE